ncbi:transcriptional regulator, GntR family [Caminicella sporogenes DSM 14501]|uniref:Transcriptional regulator, GntR family n=1 Tax=Caminicella sporogenes DSM 14501 TaxID=1121266 RepID=A0A1M6Q8S9_9FIRM|nr:GntR family transcriptional regulator [Caminicella sporogenes]RKD23616.1 GntR family transcriptional regulator [Caminicella sporogenes]SHK16493.1 transcriptional regulator, GntR family [Caminicella sporogenes DSM 14501]
MNIVISNSSKDPIYLQIANQIKNQIINGDLKENDVLPSIRGLAKELQISVITTKRAYEELEREGFINTVLGKGTFVASQSRELLRERRMRRIEEKLLEAVEESRVLGLSLEELQEMLAILFKEG